MLGIYVQYLKWNENLKLLPGMLMGEVYPLNENNYKDVSGYTEDGSLSEDDFEILDKVYDSCQHHDGNDNCKIPYTERSMCVGDLITIVDTKTKEMKIYIVASRGFKLIKQYEPIS